MSSWFAGSVEEKLSETQYLCRTEDGILLLVKTSDKFDAEIGDVLSGLGKIQTTESELIPVLIDVDMTRSLYDQLQAQAGNRRKEMLYSYGVDGAGHEFLSPTDLQMQNISPEEYGLNQPIRRQSMNKQEKSPLVDWVLGLAEGVSAHPIGVLDYQDLYPFSRMNGEKLTADTAGPLLLQGNVDPATGEVEDVLLPPSTAAIMNVLHRLPSGIRYYAQQNIDDWAQFLFDAAPVHQFLQSAADFGDEEDEKIRAVGDPVMIALVNTFAPTRTEQEKMTGLGKAGYVAEKALSSEVLAYFSAAHEMCHALSFEGLGKNRIDLQETAADSYAFMAVAQKFPDCIEELELFVKARQTVLLVGDLDHATGRGCQVAFDLVQKLSAENKLSTLSSSDMLEISHKIALDQTLTQEERKQIIDIRRALIRELVDFEAQNVSISDEDFDFFRLEPLLRKGYVTLLGHVAMDPAAQKGLNIDIPPMLLESLAALEEGFVSAEDLAEDEARREAYLRDYKQSFEVEIAKHTPSQTHIRYYVDSEIDYLEELHYGSAEKVLAEQRCQILEEIAQKYCSQVPEYGDVTPQDYEGFLTVTQPILSFARPEETSKDRRKSLGDLLTLSSAELEQQLLGATEVELKQLEYMQDATDVQKQHASFRAAEHAGKQRFYIAHALLARDTDGAFLRKLDTSPKLLHLLTESLSHKYNYCEEFEEGAATYEWLCPAYVEARYEALAAKGPMSKKRRGPKKPSLGR